MGCPFSRPTNSIQSWDNGASEHQGASRQGITVPQLQALEKTFQEKCKHEGWTDCGAQIPSTSINMYHIVQHVIKPETKKKHCTYVELIAQGVITPPDWFASHPWSATHTVLVEGLKYFVRRIGFNASFWLAAYCLVQREGLSYSPVQVMGGVLRRVQGMVVIVDPQCRVWRRMWCCVEMVEAIKGELRIDLVTVAASTFEVSMLSDGPTGSEQPFQRQEEDVRFPLEVLRQAVLAGQTNVGIQLEKCLASTDAEEYAILNFIINQQNEMGSQGMPPAKHPRYDEVNLQLRRKLGLAFARLATLQGNSSACEALLARFAQQQQLALELRQCIHETLPLVNLPQVQMSHFTRLIGSLPPQQPLATQLPFSVATPHQTPMNSFPAAAADVKGHPQACHHGAQQQSAHGSPITISDRKGTLPQAQRTLAQSPSEASTRLGVSLAYLLGDFQPEAKQATQLEDPTFTQMAEVIAKGPRGKGKGMVCPRDGREDCSVVDALPPQNRGPVTHFLSWCWDYKLSVYTQAWTKWLQDKQEASDGGFGDARGIFVWQCFFCNNQYRYAETDVTNLDELFSDRMKLTTQMVVLFDKFLDPHYLRRIWCIFELYTAATDPKMHVEIMLPPQEATEIEQMMMAGGLGEIRQCYQNVDSKSAQASRPKDEEMVKKYISNGGGFGAVDDKVREWMMVWLQQRFQQVFQAKTGGVPGLSSFLESVGLGAYQDVIQQAGITTKEQLQEAEDHDLRMWGFDDAAIKKFRAGMATDGSRPLRVDFRKQLLQLGVPLESFAGMDEDEVLRIPQEKWTIKLPVAWHRMRFQQWRHKQLAGENVTEELVTLGSFVERGPDWCYDADSDDDITPEDGRGCGQVVGWRTASGEAHGQGEGAVPAHAGWVRVEWLVTSFRHNYRLGGALEKADLAFAFPPESSAATLDRLAKGELQVQHLRCTFGYALGVAWSHYTKFDIRPAACRKVCQFEHGDVISLPDGGYGTCIGVKYNAEKGKVQAWFHASNKQGAGLYKDEELENAKFVKKKHVREARREDFEGASDDDIEHDEQDWLTKNLKPTLQYRAKSGRVMEFDTRPEMIAKFKMPFKSGDVVLQMSNGEQMTCIGLACDPMHRLAFEKGLSNNFFRGNAMLWFHVDGSVGAGISRTLYRNVSRHKVLRNVEVTSQEAVQQEGWDPARVAEELRQAGASLQADFVFPRGAGKHAADHRFDVREEVVERITGWKPGTVVTTPSLAMEHHLTLIGIAMNPDTGEPGVWWHYEDGEEVHAGAGQLEGWEMIRPMMREVGERKDLTALRERLRNNPEAILRPAAGGADGGAGVQIDAQQALQALQALQSQSDGCKQQ